MKFLSNILVKAGLVVEGSTQLNSLAGVGTRMVVTNAAGVVSTQAIPVSSVTSVFGRAGAVVAQAGDYTTAQVTESGNLYYTDARARAAISVAGSGSYNPSTGVITINGGVTSVNTLTGAVVLTTSNISEGTNLYYTDARARAAISLTTTGSSGAATYIGGVLNIPNYTLAGLGGISGSGAAGQVTYWDGTSSVSGSNNLFWDNTNGRLGIGTNAPSSILDIQPSTGSPTFRIARNSGADFRIGSSTLAIGALIGTYSAAPISLVANSATVGTITSGGNFILGVSTDNGQRLQVYGDTLLRGTGNDASTFTLTVQSNNQNNILRVRNDQKLLIGQASTSAAPAIYAFEGTTGLRSLRIGIQSAGSLTPIPAFNINQENDYTYTTGTGEFTTITANFLPTSGTGTLAYLSLKGTINQTGGANGITRGLYVNPTLTAAADWRSIEWSNNAATAPSASWGLYGAGTAPNYLAGDLRVNQTANTNAMIFASTTNRTNVVAIRAGGSATQSTSIGFFSNQTLSSANTAEYTSFSSNTDIAAGTYTIPIVTSYFATSGTKPAGVTITNMYGFFAESTLIQGTNNYGFYGSIAAATGRWNLYMNGTAANYLNGSLLIGSATDDGINKLQVSGSILATTNSTISGLSVGKGAGNVATNTAVGASALITNSIGVQNTAVGNEALRLNTTGLQNSAFGYRASRATTTGSTNSAFGIDALRVNTTGNNNAAFGAQALDNNTAGNNTAIGTGALLDNISGTGNTALGYRAGFAGSLLSNITGSNNIFIGADSLGESTSDSNRTFIGNTSTTSTWLGGRLLLGSRTDDAANRLQVTGPSALVGVTYINTNASIAGYGHSLQVLANTSGGMVISTTNSASGIGIINSSSSNKTWDISPFNNNLAINESGIANGTRMYFAAGGNVLIGSITDDAVNKLQVTGSISATLDSVINGVTIGKGGGSGALNTAVGTLALSANTTGASNTAFGLGALATITTGSDNVGIGTNAGRYRNGTTVNDNSSGGVYIGNASRASATATTNEIVIGAGAQGNGDNTVTIGNTGIVSTALRGNVTTNGSVRSDITQTAQSNNISISLLGSNITTYPSGFFMNAAGYGLNAIYAQHEHRFGGNALFLSANIAGGGLIINKFAPTAAGTVTVNQIPTTGTVTNIRTMSNLHLMTQFEGNNNLTVTHMSGLHIYGNYRTSGTGVITVSGAYYGVLLADPNEFGAGATITGSNYGFYQQGAAPFNHFGGKVIIGTTATDGTSKLRITGLPTSATGLLAGEVWNNGGVLTIV